MPELPEVETIRKCLLRSVRGRVISRLSVSRSRMVRRGPSLPELARRVRGRTILGIRRRGKALLFSLDSPDVLVVRLGMTGQLLWFSPGTLPGKDRHTHVTVSCEGGGGILFRDVRQFGEIYLVKGKNLAGTLRIGLEPLKRNFTPEVLGKIAASPVKIKTLLMDQKRIAGIGNIYSDEILFEAAIHPLKPASSLKDPEIYRLHRAIGSILREAIAYGGDTISDYRTPSGEKGRYQNYHRVYQRAGEPCRRCRTSIARVKLAGRSCHFCPNCQR